VKELRGTGRWDEALDHVDDPLARADLLNEQALFTGSADARPEGFQPGVAAALLTLGEVAAEHGRPDQARDLFTEARTLAQEVGAEPFLRRIEAALAALG
jgi:hypothetical protein